MRLNSDDTKYRTIAVKWYLQFKSWENIAMVQWHTVDVLYAGVLLLDVIAMANFNKGQDGK